MNMTASPIKLPAKQVAKQVAKRSTKRPMSALLLLAIVGLGGAGCAYGGVATTADGTIIVARNSLFGGLRKIYLCKLVGEDFKCVESTNAP